MTQAIQRLRVDAHNPVTYLKRGTLKEKKNSLKFIHTDKNPISSSALHTQTTVWCLINNSRPDLHRTKVENEQQKGTGKARMPYFEAMCPGSHTVGLDHGDEDGDVAQWTALTARYTDTQSIGGTLWEWDKGAIKLKLLSTIAKPILCCSDVNGLTRVISTVRTPVSVSGGI